MISGTWGWRGACCAAWHACHTAHRPLRRIPARRSLVPPSDLGRHALSMAPRPRRLPHGESPPRARRGDRRPRRSALARPIVAKDARLARRERGLQRGCGASQGPPGHSLHRAQPLPRGALQRSAGVGLEHPPRGLRGRDGPLAGPGPAASDRGLRRPAPRLRVLGSPRLRGRHGTPAHLTTEPGRDAAHRGHRPRGARSDPHTARRASSPGTGARRVLPSRARAGLARCRTPRPVGRCRSPRRPQELARGPLAGRADLPG